MILATALMLTGCMQANNVKADESSVQSDPGKSTAVPTTSAAPVESTGSYPMKITDSRGNVTQLDKEPLKVISLSPNITEIIYALGKGDRLVGRTAFCDYPQEAQNVTVVGDFIEWNFEAILSLEPDVVFASSLNTEENEKKLMDLGIQIVFLTQDESFESTYETIGMVARVLNAEETSAEIIRNMQQAVTEVQKAVEGLDKPTVYYVVGYGEYGDYTATGETFIASMLAMAGADNIAADITGWVYSLEKLMEKDPYMIICSEDAKRVFQETNGYKELTAVKEGRIYAHDENILQRQGPRLAEGLRMLAEIIHPDSF
ncbi:MAG: ABC transporter substrate-binding protein [Thermoclostridium sp.]|nr:ABC transporter substrate-binding protein [Thermoclostridium sp.]